MGKLWTIAGILIPILLTFAGVMISLNPPEIDLAKLCFIASAGVLALVAITWFLVALIKRREVFPELFVLLIVVFFIWLSLPKSLHWVDKRQAQYTASQKSNLMPQLSALGESTPTPKEKAQEPAKSLPFGDSKRQCSISMNVTSSIIARVHSRAMWLPSGSTEVYKPVFQDLFHDSVIKLTPQKTASKVTVFIQDTRNPVDNIRVEPTESSIISKPKAGWISGFEELAQIPDFYVRTVYFPTLTKPTTITIRRSIKSQKSGVNTITSLDLDLDRSFHASAKDCNITLTPLAAANTRFQSLTEQLRFMLARKWAGPKGPIITTRLNPDEPYPPLAVNESEMIMEARCSNSQCTTLSIEMQERTRVH